MKPGSLLIDAGVFDGTDWTVAGVVAGATVIGFDPVGKNRRLFEERFPPAVAAVLPQHATPQCQFYTMLPVVPGQSTPRPKWADVYPARSACGGSDPAQGPGHAWIIGAALGDKVKQLNMTTR